MSKNPDTSYEESEKIHILIELLNEIQKLNIKNLSVVPSGSIDSNSVMIQQLLYDSMVIVAESINKSFNYIAHIIADINVTDTRGFQTIYFCHNIIDWLATGDKSALKEVLLNNISEDNHDSDLQAIESWYKEG